MADLATVADLEARLGRSLDAAEVIRAEALLAGASARVRSYTGQQFEQTTTTARLRVRNGRVRLPQRPVTAVTAVADVDANAINFTWHAGDSLTGFGRTGWVDVTYTHGYVAIPDDVIEVVCQMALRAFGVAADAGGYASESIDDYSYSVGTVAASGAVGMLDQDRAALAPYRRLGGTIRVAT